MASSESPRDLPQWLREPDTGELFLIAARGEGATFPEYLEEALKKFEEEQPSQPGLEGKCQGHTCDVFSME